MGRCVRLYEKIPKVITNLIGGIIMKSIDMQYEDRNLFQMLDSGISDMNAGRELPLADAFQRITELREQRRIARL